MKLSVVILNYNVRFFLELCLESVDRAITNIDAEVIVVDNNSSDDSCNMVKSRFPNVRLIENTTNVGFSKGNNIGVAEAKGQYICILNPDTIVPEDVFKKQLDFFERQDKVGVVGCKLIDGRGRFLPESKRNIPYPKVALKKILGKGSTYYAGHIKSDEVGEVPILVGAFMLVEKSVYDKVGGFDEDYFMYGEDIDLSYKVIKAGYKNYYFGQTAVVHFKGESTIKNLEYAKRFYGAMKIFYKKHFNQNRIFDFIVHLGINLATYLKPNISSDKPEFGKVLVFSKSKDLKLEIFNTANLSYKEDFRNALTNAALIIYDLKSYTFKDIIVHMEMNAEQHNIYFRFLSNTRAFILGSDSADERGEVIPLNGI